MNKKKILIEIFFVLVVLIITCLIIKFRTNRDIKVASNMENNSINNSILERKQEEIITPKDEIIEDSNTENIVEDTPKENPEKQKTPVVQQTKQITTSNNTQTTKSQTISNAKSQSSKQETSTSTKNKTAEQTKTETVTPTKTQETKAKTEKPKQTQETKVKAKEEKNETTTTSSPSKNTATKDEEKYVRNDAMINKIKNVINNNPSEYMKDYGYEIVVDSSIKELTNQFTFTENRVKAMINYSFGTIRIYAEDYYYNGQLIMTECYIY